MTDYSDLKALFVNCTLKLSPEVSNTTFAAWNMMHVARMLKDAGGIPAHGNQRTEWDASCRFDSPNPEHRA